MDSEDLVKLGMRYTDQYPMQPDSAAMCYHVILNRRLEESDRRADLENLTKAYINLSFLYSYKFYDYNSAYQIRWLSIVQIKMW